MHGKNICDVALSNLPSNAITEAIRSGDFIFSGSRNLVLDLAKARATPAVAGSFKESWWAIERIFDGFFQHSKFTALAVPKADGFNGSHDVHMFAGDCKDAAAARKDGLLTMYS